MSLPTAVFLDTSVLAGQQYNFSSTALTSFIPAAAARGLKLLLPDPTEREIMRQIDERSREALEALETARRRAPFLAKWEHFPKLTHQGHTTWQVNRVASREWKAFLKKFSLVKLAYDGVEVANVMKWYTDITPPFREGKKRKEFPDAFAIAILDAYSRSHSCVIAVVSEDTDFKLACNRFPSLLHFRTLPELTELLVTPDGDVSKLRASILTNIRPLDDAILVRAQEMPVIHEKNDYLVDESEILTAHSTEVRIVALGLNECTLTFDADVEGQYMLEWEEWDSERDMEVEKQEELTESTKISGTAKVTLDPKTHAISSVSLIDIEDDYIEISSRPGHRR